MTHKEFEEAAREYQWQYMQRWGKGIDVYSLNPAKTNYIYFVADENMSTLLDFKIKSVYKAQSGENGGVAQRVVLFHHYLPRPSASSHSE